MSEVELKGKPMKTNEARRNESDRRIPLEPKDIYLEFIGNMKGTTQRFFLEKENKQLIFYNNDGGFTQKDEEAIFVKNQSGDNRETAGLNGMGCRLAIDRILPENGWSTIYSISENGKRKTQ